ncbi:hypothetical protein J6590_072120, partial [Homalodisca vitripennis]
DYNRCEKLSSHRHDYSNCHTVHIRRETAEAIIGSIQLNQPIFNAKHQDLLHGHVPSPHA